jgi:spore germination protein GerM
MKRLIAIAATLAALTTACAESGAQPLGPAPGDGSPSPTASPSVSATSNPTPSPTPVPKSTYEVWFHYDGALFVSHRTRPVTTFLESWALDDVLAGPTAKERATGLGTAIAPGTESSGYVIKDGIATVSFRSGFTAEETPAVAAESLAEIVYTLTQFDSVEGVAFEVDGARLTNFGGYELRGPQRRANFADQLPFILVQTPGVGERVSSPVTISGSADVFEAVVSIAILDEHGRTVASTFTMATCGTGCRGSYAADVRYHVGTRQPGTLRVYEVSAKDGSPIHVVEIPVLLTP